MILILNCRGFTLTKCVANMCVLSYVLDYVSKKSKDVDFENTLQSKNYFV